MNISKLFAPYSGHRGSGLRRIVCLAALLVSLSAANEVRAQEYTINIYDGATLNSYDVLILSEMSAYSNGLLVGSSYTFIPLGNSSYGFTVNSSTLKCSAFPTGMFAANLGLPVPLYDPRMQYSAALKNYSIIRLKIDVAINDNTFPDEDFRWHVSKKCDTDGNGRLSSEEIAAVTEIDVSWSDIASLKGIEYFTALTILVCFGNQLTTLDLSQNSIESADLDGNGTSDIDTGVGFLDHMLTLFAKHARFDLYVEAKGDNYVDDHHTVEDVGIVLGQAFAEAVGDKKGICRYGDIVLPMDEALILCAVDISGRDYLGYSLDIPTEKVGTFDTELTDRKSVV